MITKFMYYNEKYSESEALEAIQARINGEYDNPLLQKLGPLMVHTNDDILRIIEQTILPQ